MSWQATAWVSGIVAGGPTGKLLLYALANYANDLGECWPSDARLMADTELSQRSLTAWKRRLEADGLIAIVKRRGEGGSWLPDLVRLRLDSAAGCGARDSAPDPVVAAAPTPQEARTAAGRTGTKKDHSPVARGANGEGATISTSCRHHWHLSPSPLASGAVPPTPPYKAEPSLEPSIEPAAAAARARDGQEARSAGGATGTEGISARSAGGATGTEENRLERLEDALREAAGLERDPNPALFVVGEIAQMIADGADLELDVLAVVRAWRARCERGKRRPPRSWGYFVPMIREAMEKRRAAGGAAAVVAGPKLDVGDGVWRARLGAGRRCGQWPRREWGPAPGEDGCACPAGLIEPGDGDGWADRGLVER